MADNKKDNDTEFDDDAFDTEFNDINFEDGSLEDDGDFAELSADDVDDDFESDEWQDDQDKKTKNNLYTGDEKRGLSFNAMVMIGAFVIGAGVLAFTVMSEGNKARSGEKTMFQSIMSMAGVMDGVLGRDEGGQPTQADVIAQEQQSQTEGFLNNPDVIQPPPQPAPISSPESEPLTPMPEDTAGVTPRGPDDQPPVAADVASASPDAMANGVAPAMNEPAPTDSASAPAPGSAEELLQKAMANRQTAQTNGNPTAPEAEDTPMDEPVATAPASAEAPNLAASAPVADPVVSAPSGSAGPASASQGEVAALDAKIETLLKRMDQIETDIGSVKSQNSGYQQIEQTVAALKTDVSALKDRPAPTSRTASETARRDAGQPLARPDDAGEEPTPAVTETPKKKRVRAAAAKSPDVQSAAEKPVNGRWELRAAQPGRAWVSKPGQRDMQTVEVGQNLSGIGKVSAITYQNGRWTIYGAQGQIQQ